MSITLEQLKAIMPLSEHADDFVDPLNAAMSEFGIETSVQQAAFIAQCAHESAQLNRLSENLNYSWQALRRVFPKYFSTDFEAQQYDRQSERIANYVYANRNGNGQSESGDGWTYRGRGLFQITGRDNYLRCSGALDADFIFSPDSLTDPINACRSAAWFWSTRRMNEVADDIIRVTHGINGGDNGLEERSAFFTKAKEILCANS